MIAPTSVQAPVGDARITGRGAVEALSAFAREARDFFADNVLLLGGLVVLAVIVFQLTRPRVH